LAPPSIAVYGGGNSQCVITKGITKRPLPRVPERQRERRASVSAPRRFCVKLVTGFSFKACDVNLAALQRSVQLGSDSLEVSARLVIWTRFTRGRRVWRFPVPQADAILGQICSSARSSVSNLAASHGSPLLRRNGRSGTNSAISNSVPILNSIVIPDSHDDDESRGQAGTLLLGERRTRRCLRARTKANPTRAPPATSAAGNAQSAHVRPSRPRIVRTNSPKRLAMKSRFSYPHAPHEASSANPPSRMSAATGESELSMA